MKTKRFLLLITLVSFSTLFLVTGCKKDDEPTPVNTESLQQTSDDENRLQDETDRIMNDANVFIMQGELKSTAFMPCNANLDSVVVVNDTVVFYITYNGLSCNGKFNRTGNVEMRIPQGTFWVQPGATMNLKLINYTVTRVATNKTMVLNGIKNYTNVTGGHIGLLGITYDTIVHEVSGSLQATFENNTTRTWEIARRKTFTGASGQLEITLEGFGTSGEMNNLVTWGVNRAGEEFYSQIQQPIVLKETCDFNAVSGIKKHMIPSDSKSATVTFGFNDNNQPIGPGECPTKYKLDWEKNGNSGTLYLPVF